MHLRILVSALSTPIKNIRTSGRYIHARTLYVGSEMHVIVGGVLLHVRATKAQDAQPR